MRSKKQIHEFSTMESDTFERTDEKKQLYIK